MKIIWITQRVDICEAYGERRDALSQEWNSFLSRCGFLLIPVPNEPELVRTMTSELPCNGILLSGGNDLYTYGGQAPERDKTEYYLIQYAIDHSLPLLGVCRGMQILLDYFKVKLIEVDGHIRTTHMLTNGRTANSFHRLGAKNCPGFQVAARSLDGVAEEEINESHRNLHGIMWHPERYHEYRDEDIEFVRSVFK